MKMEWKEMKKDCLRDENALRHWTEDLMFKLALVRFWV